MQSLRVLCRLLLAAGTYSMPNTLFSTLLYCTTRLSTVLQVYTNLKSRKFQDQGGDPRFDSGAEQWDAVVTCFFVDTAPVVLE